MTTPTQHPASTSDARKRAADLATPDRGGDLRGPLDLDAIRARVDAATEGPWIAAGHTVYGAEPGDQVAECDWRPDATFIRHARSDVPALLAEVERLRAWGAVIAAVTPCSCSAQRARAETAEAERDEARVHAEAEAASRVRLANRVILAEADLAAAREALARAEALADEWERNYASMLIAGFSGASVGADTAAKRIRAALARPATDEGAWA